jgi:hypothetical protein
MARKHVFSLCFTLVPFSDYSFFLFLAFSITTLAFVWYRSSGSRSNRSTPHCNKGRSDAMQDIFSVLKKPTTSTTVATTYITSSAVTRADTASIPPRNEEQQQSSMKEQWTCQPYDVFLVLDVEATCLQGTDFHWPNEIIVSYRIEMRSHR